MPKYSHTNVKALSTNCLPWFVRISWGKPCLEKSSIRHCAISLAVMRVRGKQSVQPVTLQIEVRTCLFMPEPGLNGPTISNEIHSNGSSNTGCFTMGTFQGPRLLNLAHFSMWAFTSLEILGHVNNLDTSFWVFLAPR